ncbi:glycoside hydrolase superfamily [Pyronema omphalodes]|nr:glycoside hydrolase superfamily [Pyronema omphalodes]
MPSDLSRGHSQRLVGKNTKALLVALLTAVATATETTFAYCTLTSPFTPQPSSLSIASLATSPVISWGVSLDTSSQSLDDYTQSLGGRGPTIVNLYFNWEHLGGLNEPLNCHIAAVKAAGAVLMLTIEPWQGLGSDVISDEKVEEMAKLAREINNAGVGLFVRFAHEMNGDWYPWGANPKQFTAAFSKISKAIKAATKNTLMVWAPNTGVGYPFRGAGKYFPSADSEQYKQMDTNQDGALDANDDPFTPYYPGDDVVDWVGISLYSKRENSKPTELANTVADRTSLQTYITNPNADKSFDIYTKFVKEKGKPFMIAETGASFYPGYPVGDGDVAVKRNWWRQFWSPETRELYPLLKAVVYFEYLKPAQDTGEVRDYTISKDPPVLAAFLADIKNSDAVAFLDTHSRKLVGGNGGCACVRPSDKESSASGRELDGIYILLGVLMSLWVAMV